MIALKLVFQSLAGVVAVGGAVGGTVALSRNPNQEHYERPHRKTTEIDLDVNNETTRAFYLVSAAVEVADTIPSTDLFTDEKNPTEKNYQCINRSQTTQRYEEIITKDSSCILYSLKKTTNTPLKISEIKTQTQQSDFPTKVTKTTEIAKNKFFLLQANNNLIKSWVNDREPIIYLTIKNTKDFFYPPNYYASIKVHAKIFNNELTGITNTIIAKATSDKQSSTKTPNASSPSYKCSFKSEEPKTDCTLSKLTGYTCANFSNFQNQSIKNRSEATTTETDNYYLIKTNENIPHEFQTLKSSTAKYIETNSQNSTTTTTLNIEASVFAKFNNDATRLTELIILD